MLEKSYFFKHPEKDPLHLKCRVGKDCHCYPKEDLSNFSKYRSVEILYLFKRPDGEDIPQKLSFWVGEEEDPYYYENAFDGLLCCPITILNDTLFVLKEQGFILENENKKSILDSNGCCCRVCNEFNDYADPDGICIDGKYTCYNCGTHPYKYSIGLVNDEQKNKMLNIYKGKGFLG